MGEKATMSDFERLLQERAQIEKWLERLSASGDKTPANVRERVQNDYQKRLSEVQQELNGHRDEITDALDRHRSVRDELLNQQSESEEKRAEAELRHTVGEYDDAKWEGIRDEIDGSLTKIREELIGVDAEIAELENALSSIDSTSEEDVEKTTAEAEPELTVEPESTEPPKPADLPPPIRDSQPVAAVTPTTEATGDSPSQTPPGGDLEFLDVDIEADTQPKAEDEGTAVPMPPDAAELLKHTPPSQGSLVGSELGAEGVTSFSKNAEQPKKGAAKTLKCAECGAMNLPTEWYCERCGAELAAL